MVKHLTMVPGIDLRKYYRRTYKTLSNHAGDANGYPDRLAEILAQKGSVNPVFKQNHVKRALGNAMRLATNTTGDGNAPVCMRIPGVTQ